MTRYLEVSPAQEVFTDGLDDDGRTRWVFNVDVLCEATTEFEEEIAQLLLDAGVGTLATDIFLGPRPKLPTGAGPYLSLASTGGAPPLRTHNEISPPALPRPSAQIVVRGKNATLARAMAINAYNALTVRNTDVYVTGDGPLKVRLFNSAIIGATLTELYRDGSSARLVIPSNTTAKFRIDLVLRRTDGGGNQSASWEIKGTVSNDGGTTALDGPVEYTPIWEDDPAWTDPEVTANDSADAMVLKAASAAGVTVNAQADVWLTRSTG